jgi:long-chain acyl-CoA synthetase
MNPALSARAVEFYLTITDARMLFFTGRHSVATTVAALTAGTPPIRVGKRGIERLTAGFAGRAEPVSRAEDDTAVILHTSGATGVPTGAQLTHGDLAGNQAFSAGSSLLGLGADDVVMGCLPLFEGFGMTCGLLASISTGVSLVLLPRFNSRRALETIAAERVTVFEGLPSMYKSMLAAADRSGVDFSSLRLCVATGPAMPADMLRRFEDRFGCMVLEEYRLSETSSVAGFNHPSEARKVRSLGRAIDGLELRVVDDQGCEVPVGVTGELQIRGHNVMKGYSRLPEATEAALVEGWLATGDIGKVDEHGHLFIVDEKKT